MALPWPFAGMGLQVLPKPGRYMVVVKYLFVLLIAGMALYYALLVWQLRPGTYSAQAELAKLESAAVQAQKEQKLLLVDIWATWCANCKEMEKSVLVQPEVKEALKNYVLVKFQAEQLDDPAIRTLLSSWGIPGLPGFVIIDPKLPRKAF